MNDLQAYYENTQKPWGQLFYQTIWRQLSFVREMNVLDYGSGFGITANHLAVNNNVVAIEPNERMCNMRFHTNSYHQVVGGIEKLEQFPQNHFDMIICHNVLEYTEDKERYIKALCRILKKAGTLSLVKHNRVGRIIQRIVFENNLELASQELEGGPVFAQNFGEIKYYDKTKILSWADKYFMNIDNLLGVRMFFGLIQNNEIKYDQAWQEKILNLELKSSNIDEYKNIAFYHHVLLSKQ